MRPFARIRQAVDSGQKEYAAATEWALILASVAIVVFVTYEMAGHGFSSLIERIYSSLNTAS
jgi:Flp pilus assembly pilin Flp